MEIFVWLEVMTDQVEWKFAIITYGELFVMMVGMSGMLEWYADNLDYLHCVSAFCLKESNYPCCLMRGINPKPT